MSILLIQSYCIFNDVHHYYQYSIKIKCDSILKKKFSLISLKGKHK